MNDETMGQEDAAQDAEACAEALESLDRISLDEIAFDDSGVDVQDEPETEARIPAGELPADAGGCAGDPYSFRHGSSLFCKAGGPVDGVPPFVGEAGVVEGGGFGEVVGEGGTWLLYTSDGGGDTPR